MIDGTVHIDGWHWPLADTEARGVILRDCARDVTTLLEHVPERDIIVQAGGNVGVYPLALADHFSSVITYEPDPINWECLAQNLKARDSLHRVTAWNSALGEEMGSCSMRVHSANNCGAHYVAYGEGTVPVNTIDGLGLAACSAIWLDCEGSEVFALKGARETIRRFSPTICCEDKGLDREHFGVAGGTLQEFLGQFGYAEVARFGRDKVFRKVA